MSKLSIRDALKSGDCNEDWSMHVPRDGRAGVPPRSVEMLVDGGDLSTPHFTGNWGRRPTLLNRRRWKLGQKRNRRQRREGRAESVAFHQEAFTCVACKDVDQPHEFPRWKWRNLEGRSYECPSGHPALLLHMPLARRAGAKARVEEMRRVSDIRMLLIATEGSRTP